MLTARLAWRLSRGQTARLWLLVACVAIGIAARVCVGSFTGTVERALAREARPLLGGDLEIAANQPLTADKRSELDAALPAGSRIHGQLRFTTMGSCAENSRSRPVEVRAVDAGHPLAGGLQVADHRGDAHDVAPLFGDEPVAYVQRELLAQIGAVRGGTLRLGATSFRIVGELIDEPGLGANPFALGPRVLIARSRAEATGLVGALARVRHVLLVALPEPAGTEPVATALREQWKVAKDDPSGFGGRVGGESGIAIRTARQAQESVSRTFDRMTDWLRLVSLIALLLGGVGVAALVRGFVTEHLDAVATLQVLGARPNLVVRIFLVQAAAVGVVGGVLGGVIGTLAQDVLVMLLAGWLPAGSGMAIDWRALGWGLVLSVGTAVGFAALPLAAVRGLRPLAVMRGDGSAGGGRLATALLGLVLLGAFMAVAALEARSWVLGPMFVGILAAGSALNAGLGALVLSGIARLKPRIFGFGVRHGLANLGRPGFRPVAALVALAAAAQLLATMTAHRASLDRELDISGRSGLPGFFAIDVQDDQVEEFRALLAREFKLADVALSPVVRARLTGINGNVPAAGGDATREAERNRFMRRREQNLSWRDKPDDLGERLTAGHWMRPDSRQIECSLEQRFAKNIGAKLGDTLSFDVQGVPVDAVVTSLRQVRWASLRPNFFVLLSPHALLGAPVMWIAAIPQVAEADRARLPGVLAQHFPNVTAFDIADTGARVTAVIDRVILAVRGVAALALVAGLAVLIGVALSTARARRTDAALIAVLGGGRRTLLTSLTAEFAALGLAATVLGAGQGILHAWAVAAWFELPLTVPLGELALLAGSIALAATIAGVLACRRAMSAPPLAVLRDE